jgi:hypothetical protein
MSARFSPGYHHTPRPSPNSNRSHPVNHSRSNAQRVHRVGKREDGVHAVNEATRLTRFSTKLPARQDKDGDVEFAPLNPGDEGEELGTGRKCLASSTWFALFSLLDADEVDCDFEGLNQLRRASAGWRASLLGLW